MTARELVAAVDHNPMYLLAAIVAVLIVLVMLRRGVRSAAAVMRRGRDERPEGHMRRAENTLTLLAAGVATAVQATGMWKFFGTVLHFSGPLRVLLFAFIELAVFTSALRARNNVAEREDHSAGGDGIAVWALTGLSAVLATIDAGSFAEGVFRLAAPLVAAWLWERGLSVERRRRRRTGTTIHWRITPERMLVRLGLAEASDRTASDVDAHRRIARFTKAAHTVRRLRASGAGERRLARAVRRLDAAMDAAVEHAGIADDPNRQQALLDQLGARYNAAALVDLSVPAPWAHSAEPVRTSEPPHSAHDADLVRTVDPHQPLRTARTRSARTDSVNSSAPVRRGAKAPSNGAMDIDRAALVEELAEQIRDAVDAGEQWRPDYANLIDRSGYKRRWCEEVVRDAKLAVLSADDGADTTQAVDVRALPPAEPARTDDTESARADEEQSAPAVSAGGDR